MKAVMVMFDSLNRHMLPPYGCDWTIAPNFKRLAEETVQFNRAYVGSMPCMPARRELHTGRYNFLHRSWGPLEPFDDSAPRLLRDNGVYTHLVSDHYHYWEDGGCTYHTRYSSWEITRGQEGEPWKGVVDDPEIPDMLHPPDGNEYRLRDIKNRKYMQKEEDQPQARTFKLGLEFLETNHSSDNWFLHIETFDPHEPYFTQQKYKDLYPHDYSGPEFDWPVYGPVTEESAAVEHCRYENAALISMCDNYLGRVLDAMDKYDLWKDTMLIVNTDHGFLLGEHDFWAKCAMPFYNEIAHMPLFIWDPRSGRKGIENNHLVQTIDLPATLLEYFSVDLPEHMQGVPLRDTIEKDTPVREAGLFGVFGGHVNVTDGRYVYMRAPEGETNEPLFNYTLMPTHMRDFFRHEELADAVLADPFSFTKGLKTLKCGNCGTWIRHGFNTMLFDLENDPRQQNPINDPEVEQKMIRHLVRLMKENDAPAEQFERLGLDPDMA